MTDTVGMSSATDATGGEAVTKYATYTSPNHCDVTHWCEEAHGHDDAHRKHLLHQRTGVHGMDVDSGRTALVGLVRQGETSALSAPVLILDNKQVALPWKLAVRIARAILAEAKNVPEDAGTLENI